MFTCFLFFPKKKATYQQIVQCNRGAGQVERGLDAQSEKGVADSGGLLGLWCRSCQRNMSNLKPHGFDKIDTNADRFESDPFVLLGVT